MKNQRVLTILTLINAAILIVVLSSQFRTVEASGDLPVLRGRALEIVDGQGKVRASIHIVPAGPAVKADGSKATDGRNYPETVRFQLIRPDGRPSMKMTTSEEGSGLTLGGGIDPTYIVLTADQGTPSLSLTNKEGKLQVIKP
jgi:hypothetical protein